MTLMFTDIVGSVAHTQRLGAAAYGQLLSHHHQLLRDALTTVVGHELLRDTGDGCLVRFEKPSDAVRVALRFQHDLHRFNHSNGNASPGSPGSPAAADCLHVRIGIHLGELTEIPDAAGKPQLVGMAINMVARIMDLAQGGQVLLTRHAFDDARQFVREHPGGSSRD